MQKKDSRGNRTQNKTATPNTADHDTNVARVLLLQQQLVLANNISGTQKSLAQTREGGTKWKAGSTL